MFKWKVVNRLRVQVSHVLTLLALFSGVCAASVNPTLVTQSATKEATALYQFLCDNYGKKIISGAMTLNSMDESNWLNQNTGKQPALVGIDFMQTNRKYSWYNDQTPGNDAINYYNKNGIPILCWHWRDPSRKTEEFYSKSTSFDVTKINDATSAEYKAMLSDIDYTAGLLKKIQDAKAAILWRPLHEAAGGWFWWGKNGPACKKLWQIMYDRMVNYHGLKNMIWVWTKEANDDAFYPGDEYVDIIGRDYYNDGDHGSQIGQFTPIDNKFANKKIVTISECGSFPDPDNLVKDKAIWSWYMVWYGDFVRNSKYNSLDLWKKALGHSYVITLDEMPNLKTYQTAIAVEKTRLVTPLCNVHYLAASHTLTIESSIPMRTVAFFTVAGVKVQQQQNLGTKTAISCKNLRTGTYIIRVNGNSSFKMLIP